MNTLTITRNDVLCAYCEENYLTDSIQMMCDQCENKRECEPDYDEMRKDEVADEIL